MSIYKSNKNIIYEHGSEFDWRFHPSCKNLAGFPWGEKYRTYATGRDALADLVLMGMKSRGWKRLYLPEYYCNEVIQAIITTGIEYQLYPVNFISSGKPGKNVIFTKGDVLLRVNLFGIEFTGENESGNSILDIIEDHTHDPLSNFAKHSNAEWCFCSLRKTLPLPDGAVLWSPKQNCLPSIKGITTSRQIASLKKMASMILKSEYLKGKKVSKEIFRELATNGEKDLSINGISGMSPWSEDLLKLFPIQYWRKKRFLNYQFFLKKIGKPLGISVLASLSKRGLVPFSIILLFDTKYRRNYVRDNLIKKAIYPSILWPIESDNKSLSSLAYKFSNRMLSIHCDMRYSYEDMGYVIKIINNSNL